jgi:hypothetical protein
MAAAVDEDVPARRRPACIDRLDPWRRISARHARLPNSMAIPADHAQSRACARRSIGRGRTGSQLRGGDREAMRDVTRPVPNRRREGDNKSNRRVRSPAAADRSGAMPLLILFVRNYAGHIPAFWIQFLLSTKRGGGGGRESRAEFERGRSLRTSRGASSFNVIPAVGDSGSFAAPFVLRKGGSLRNSQAARSFNVETRPPRRSSRLAPLVRSWRHSSLFNRRRCGAI